MKKLLALLLTAMLLCSTALADVFNFGDFNMDIDPEMKGTLVEKADTEIFLRLYPSGDTRDRLVVSWSKNAGDLTAIDPRKYASDGMQATADSLTSLGIAISNQSTLLAVIDEQDGKPVLIIMTSCDADYSGMGVDLQCTLYELHLIVSDESVGTYFFTAGTQDKELLLQMKDILASLTWNF